jgi:RNA polymerase sigma-70 factor (ECF subfamily)
MAPCNALKDELDLISRALAHDPSAVREIIQANNRRLYRIARGVMKNDSEAEDVVQAAYGRAFTHLRDFRSGSSIGTWLTRIVLNEALGRLRRRRETVDLASIQNAVAGQSQVIAISAFSTDPECEVAQCQIQALLERAIDTLPEPFRLALMARTVEGMSVAEAAELLGIRPETVKTRVHRARLLLREKLNFDPGSAITEAFPFAGDRCARITSRVLERVVPSPRWWQRAAAAATPGLRR